MSIEGYIVFTVIVVIPLAYIMARVVARGYFAEKLNYQRTVLNRLATEDVKNGAYWKSGEKSSP